MHILLIIIIILIIIIFLSLYYFYSINKEPHFSEINDDCLYKRFGCCNDKLTPKLDQNGSNCRGF
jgi:uncharacterized protein YxeA